MAKGARVDLPRPPALRLTCGWQAWWMSQGQGPDANEITHYIVETFEGVDVARDRDIGIFFSRDPEKHLAELRDDRVQR